MTETQASPTVDEQEAYKELFARVGRKSGKIPADDLVRHVLKVVPSTEWPARVEAIDAILRRLESGKKDVLRLDARPDGGSPLGFYSTRRRNSVTRPYRTVLLGVAPIDGRCDCPDFLKNSLGVCKHLLVILEHIHHRPRLLRRALTEQTKWAGTVIQSPTWDPIRPLTGAGDWLERVSWPSPPASRSSRRIATALQWFQPGVDGVLVPRSGHLANPSERLGFVEDLLKLTSLAEEGPGQDPALRALLVLERDRLKRRGKQALSSQEVEVGIKGLKRSLYPYQREGVERVLTEARLLLADDMGLGKTSQAIACADILWNSGRVRRGLIIAPASLKPQWAREWTQVSHLPILVVDGSPGERKALYESMKSGLLIINYEQLLRDEETIKRWSPDLVILDEAQRIKNWSTKTALTVKGLTPTYRLVLTGTPMENRIEELASVVEWVDDMALEPKWRLNAVHSIREDGKKEVGGVRHLATLRDRLRGSMLRRVRQDVLDQLPSRTDSRVPIELTEPQQEEHDALIQPIASLVQRSKIRPLTQAEFLRLMSLLTTQRVISNGLAQLRFEEVWPSIQSLTPEESVIKGLSSPKLLELRQLVRQLILEQGRKVVVFSQWRRMLALAQWSVSDLLTGARLRSGFFTGAEGQNRRTQNIVEFHDDPDFRILFASDAGGVGLNLQHASNCVINMELPWNPAVLEQRIGRIYRLGQKKPIDVFNLVCEQGIESRIAGLVGSKQAFFKGLFDGESDSVRFDESSSFLAKVEKIYSEAALDASATAPVAEVEELVEVPDDLDLGLDDDLTDPFEPVIDAADESTDVPTATNSPSVSPEANHVLEPIPAEADAPMVLPALSDVRQLFTQLQIRREPDGRVIIEAPESAAAALGDLFEGVAALLRATSIPSK